MDVYEDRKKEMKSSRFVSFLIVNLETVEYLEIELCPRHFMNFWSLQ